MRSVFPIHRRRFLTGVLLAAAVLAVCLIRYEPAAGFGFAAAFVLAGLFRPELKNKFVCFALNALWGIVCIFLSCVFPTKMVSDTSFLDVGYYRVVMNFVCAAVVYGVCLVLTGEIKRAVGLASLLLLLLATLNGFIFQFRGNEFKPTDIYAAKTAMNVAGQYTFRVSQNMAYCWFAWLWLMFCLTGLPSADGLIPRLWFRAAAAAATVLCFCLVLYGYRDIRPNNWSNGGTTENGYLLNFAAGIRDAVIRQPEGYSDDVIASLEAEYPESQSAGEEKKPHILVIMSESYADFRVLGDGLRTNGPVSPFIENLRENTLRGYAVSPVFGGVTANAEFEFLTGNSMAFLPEGSVPYQQYLHADTFSLARVLEQEGYRIFATHPYFSTGWSRTTVYPYFGMEDYTFLEAYPQEELVRDFVSDREMYRYVLQQLQENSGSPLFLFGITMQNHGDYIYTGDNYQQTVFLEGYGQDYPMAEQYLSLIQETDRATEEFLTALEDFPEDTVVLFFGDHFPQVESTFFSDIHGSEFETLDEQMLQYTVPFFIWANFDIPEETVELTGLNYLGRYLLDTAGISLPPYYRFLEQMEQQIPALSAHGYYSRSQQAFLSPEDASGEEALWLNRYRMLQYNNLFDDAQSRHFFGQYLP